MSDYTSDLPVGPKQLEAIGMVAAEWSYLESVIDAAIWNIAGMPDEDVGAAVTTHLAWRPRLDMLATLFDLDCSRECDRGHCSADDTNRRRADFKNIRAALEPLAGERNAVVHARWVTGDYGSPLIYAVKARGTLQRTRRGLSDREIRGIAERIAEQADKLRRLFAIGEIHDGGGESQMERSKE